MRRACILVTILYLSVIGTCTAETVLTLPSSLSYVEEEAFYGNVAISEVTLPYGVLEIGKKAFAYSGVKHINLPQTLIFIADDAFEGCNLVKVTAVGDYAVKWCKDHNISIQPTDPYAGEEFFIP